MQAWGDWSVMTAGYGECEFSGSDLSRSYTPSFSGTSSASALTAGVVTSVQSWAIANLGAPLSPERMRALLVDTGVPQTGASQDGAIGPMINARSAIEALKRQHAASGDL
jgi:hypothetical protein